MFGHGRAGVRQPQRRHGLHQVHGQEARATTVGFGQQHGEFFAAVARRQVGRAVHGLLYGLRHGLQATVARRVAVVIVVLLEGIDIDHQERRGRAHALGAQPLAMQRFLEMPAIGDLRQPVLVGRIAQGVGQLLHAQVHAHAGHHLRSTRWLGDEVRGAQGQARDFVLVVFVAADEDDGHIHQQRHFLHRRANIEAAHARHFDVQQDQIGHRLAGHAQRVLPRSGKAQPTKLLQDGAEHANDGGIVIHQQDAESVLHEPGPS